MSLALGRSEPSSHSTSEAIANVARVLADPRRVEALLLLRRGPATVNEIAHSLGISPASASLQLGRLRRLEVVRVLRSGRHRIYSADSDTVARLVDMLWEVGTGRPAVLPSASQLGRRVPPPGSDLQQARTCWDHLAGATAVEFATELERVGWTIRGQSEFLLTRRGEVELTRRGVDVAACRETRRKFAPGCLDWTERKLHIGGSLGAALLRALRSDGYLDVRRGRAVRIRRPLGEWVRRIAASRGSPSRATRGLSTAAAADATALPR